ncbi:MAG: hypothetical protein ABEJ42_01865, partial [Halobacteriaceae archaeon]
MSESASGRSALERLYRRRIGEPSTPDEALGYWLFALGVVLGVLGMAAFLASESASMTREVAIALAAAGLAFLVAGPVVRLPLQRWATWLVGLVLCLAAVGWFTVVFRQDWLVATGNQPVIVLYAVGLLVMGLGGVVVPILTDRAHVEAALDQLDAEVSELRAALADTAADEADLAGAVADLRRAVADTEADEDDLARAADALRGEVADLSADEADLAARLAALHASQSRFELYEDRGGEFRGPVAGDDSRREHHHIVLIFDQFAGLGVLEVDDRALAAGVDLGGPTPSILGALL